VAAQDPPDDATVVELKTLFRVVNDEIEGVHETLGGTTAEFLCECGRQSCDTRLAMTIDEYEGVRAVPTRFAVAPGHDWPGYERVVESTPRYAVVETQEVIATRLSIAWHAWRRHARARRGLAPTAA
jgi:hypothetical protein